MTNLKNTTQTKKETSYNLTELIQLSNGSNDFVSNMLGIFVRSSTEILLQIKEAVLNEDWETVSALAHKAVPSFHFMGLIIFSEKLKYIENNASDSDKQQRVKEMIGLIDKNMSVILQELKEEAERFKS